MGYLDNDGLTRLWAKIKNYIDAHSSGGVTLDKVYPVGSIYMSVNNTNPGTLFGGTWVTWGAGRVPVSVNTSDGDFSTVEKTGGEKTHTLSINEMPSHKHSTTVKVTEKSLTGTVHNFAGQSASWGPGNTVSGICSASGDDAAFYPTDLKLMQRIAMWQVRRWRVPEAVMHTITYSRTLLVICGNV